MTTYDGNKQTKAAIDEIVAIKANPESMETFRGNLFYLIAMANGSERTQLRKSYPIEVAAMEIYEERTKHDQAA